MTCEACEDGGIVPFVFADEPRSDADVRASDLRFALCLCATGRGLRACRNGAGKPSMFALWQVWAACKQIDPARVYRVEDVFTADELRAAGLNKPAVSITTGTIAAAMRTQRPHL